MSRQRVSKRQAMSSTIRLAGDGLGSWIRHSPASTAGSGDEAARGTFAARSLAPNPAMMMKAIMRTLPDSRIR